MDEFDLKAYEKIEPVATLEGVQYCVPNQLCLLRVNSLFTKEPDTMEWISGFAPEDILIDVGANVGMYSIWAAAKRGVSVLAFEPESQNYALLCRNIFINGLQDKITAFCIAISDDLAGDGGVYFDKLNLSSFKLGTSCHTFGAEVDFNLRPTKPAFRQGSICLPLDRFISGYEMEYGHARMHIKIDVDGLEHKVIASALDTLRRDNVKSVLVELNTNLKEHVEIIGVMEGLGYRTTIHPEAIRTTGKFTGLGNHIFVRD